MEQAEEQELELEPEQHLKHLLNKLEPIELNQLPEKFNAHFQGGQSGLEDFAIYYLAALRQHTEQHFRNSLSNESETPKSQTPVRQPRPPTETDQELNESQLSQLSIGNVSTPVRQNSQGRRSTGGQFNSTPHSNERPSNRSGGGGSVSGGSFCLGDFLVNTTPNHSQQRARKKPLTPQSNTAQDCAHNKSQKPRRRVVPMTISKNASSCISFGDTSSFSNENNLLRLSQSCELDRSQGAELELEARKTLLLRRQEIKSEAPVEQEREREREKEIRPLEPVSLEDVSQAKRLQVLASIYSLLMDLNLVPNVLSEISFVLQLLNIRNIESDASPRKSDSDAPLALLTGYKECIYFAVQLLEQQQELLLQVDRKSLGVLLQHERLSLLSKEMQEQLELSCQQKQQLKSKRELFPDTQNPQQNVYYQHEKDSRDNFPSQQEFGAFKTQRDLFYKALKQWEQLHLNRLFCFGRDLRQCVREIFRQSEHAVNMAHFAKLFVSQLLMSSGETHESPEELGLKLDQQRLNRLAQRLITSNSSVEDQFPRTQAFFRDFISECGSLAFLVQLQLALYVQLLRHNDSSFELLPLQAEDEDDGEVVQSPFIVRPQALAELLMLAKFLGYVCAFPYNRSPTAYACPQQLQLRRQFQPPFEMRTHLERAMRQDKLLITLPWLVQYLAMLDVVTLQLPAAVATLELLYALYEGVVANQNPQFFIIRICLGWLLESQPALSSGYYSQRSAKSLSGASAALVADCLHSLSISYKGQAAALLEQLLPVACPFLHEFCVSITPSQRQVQRSGRFRYITTRLEQLSGSKKLQSAHSKPEETVDPLQTVEAMSSEQKQRKLVDAFLHSQNASMRRLLEFVTERSFKCVVKDAQQTILLPSKAAADALVNGIRSTQEQEVQRELQRIYQQARIQASQQWSEQVPAMLEKRIEQSLMALLPLNTHEVVRRTYSHLIRQQAEPQIQQWLETSVIQSNFYHGDLQEVAIKVCRANKNNNQATSSSGTSNEMCLTDANGLSLSGILHELQQWVHCLSLRPEYLCYMSDLQGLLGRTKEAVQLKQLPSYFYQLIGSVLVRLLQLLIFRQPHLLTENVISTSCEVWLTPQVRGTDEAIPAFLESLLSISFVQELSSDPSSFQLLHHLLHAMLKARVLGIDHLNQLFLPLFKENWTPPVWKALSQVLHQLSKDHSDNDKSNDDDDGKSHLFMEVLADLSQDLDSF
ncbi:protein disks lost [Drosophila mojavensis]|uniref:protein disks lost n=1 Tax=Drosophila mojavensis TaxID=7230 RepID=UPI001CD0DAC2|nr:protein disks lost [Drosophila mojavensis]